jgi:hypothetical protein
MCQYFNSHFLDGHFTTRDKLGTLFVVVGTVFITLVANKVDCPVSAADLMNRFSPGLTPSFLYCLCLIIWLVSIVLGQIAWSWYHSTGQFASRDFTPMSPLPSSADLVSTFAARTTTHSNTTVSKAPTEVITTSITVVPRSASPPVMAAVFDAAIEAAARSPSTSPPRDGPSTLHAAAVALTQWLSCADGPVISPHPLFAIIFSLRCVMMDECGRR